MRFMVIVKATKSSEAGVLPSEELLTAMGKYNEELTKAGVMLAGEGLHPSSKGARVRFEREKRTVIDGPFAETTELVAGFWLWKCASLQEAIQWVKRCPNPMPEESEIEIRQVFEAEDFGPALTPELREQEERLRAELEQRKGSESRKSGADHEIHLPRILRTKEVGQNLRKRAEGVHGRMLRLRKRSYESCPATTITTGESDTG